MIGMMHFSLLSALALIGPYQYAAAQAVASEGTAANTVTTTDCVTADEFDPNFDYFEGLKYEATDYSGPEDLGTDAFADKVELDGTTDLFSISYHNHYKIVTNHFVNKTYLLYLCGTQDQIPAAELEEGKHHLVLSVPHKGGVAITQTTQIPFLELLGVRRQVVAYIGDPSYVSSPCLLHMMHEENSVELVYDPDDPWNATVTTALQNQYLAENPDTIVIGGPYHDKEADRMVIAAATQERTTVATFDWVGYYAAFFNLEGMSNQIASETKARYDCSASNAATLSADRETGERPVVLWANFFQNYNWSVAECPTWDATYYCEYASHCGAHIISRPEGFGWNAPDYGGAYWYLNDDQLLELGKDADVMVYTGNWTAIYEQKKDVLDQIKAVQNEQVFDTDGKGPSAWHEQRLAEYDVVALDFCEMVGTASNSGTGGAHTRQWLRNVYNGEPVGSLPECTADEIDEPYVAEGAQCSPLSPLEGSASEGSEDAKVESDGESEGGSATEVQGSASGATTLVIGGALTSAASLVHMLLH